MPGQTESDPTGRNAHEPGAKLDHGKIRAGLVIGAFSGALAEVAAVGTFGAEKYSPNGWLEVPDAFERYEDAKLRHFLKRHSGEEFDPDSGLLHLAHEAWNALATLELYIQEHENPPGHAALTPAELAMWKDKGHNA